MMPTSSHPASGQGPSFKTALLGFLASNFVLTAAMVLLGSMAG